MSDLEEIIEDSITDIELPDPIVSDPGEDTSSDGLEASTGDSTPTPDPTPEPSSNEVPSPAIQAEKPVIDDFDKKYGLASHNSSGRENRIPYTRVKKIADNAVKDAQKSWEKERETGYVPKNSYSELEAKTKDYEGRLQQVAEFERVMVNDPVTFLKRLVQLPQYAAIFNQGPSGQGSPAPTSAAGASQAASGTDDMPLPDKDMGDGSKAYSIEGIRALLEWNARNVKTQVSREFEQRYAPLENSYNEFQRVQQVLPQVNAQIAEARTWPKFNENEDAIVKTLKDNPRFSLERAYQHVVLPKLQAERDKMRADILKEIKTAPKATAAPSGGTRPAPQASGPRSLEDIIADSIKAIPR